MKQILLLVMAIAIAHQALAQTAPAFIPRYNYNNYNVWGSFTGTAKLNKKFDAHIDLQIRQSNYVASPMQYMIRPGVIYNVNDQFALGLGYLYSITYKYGELPQTKYTFPEHRIWEQVVLKNKINRVEIQQRLRMEHRWIGEVSADMQVDRYRYQNRFRYLLRANIPLNGEKIDKGVFYLCAYDELMISFGKNVGGNVYDQNRLFGGIGYHLGKAGRIEVGYMYMNLMQRRIWYPTGNALGAKGYNVFENNHTLLVSYSFKLDFSKKAE